ncbi:MAG TPA: hypothetical protein EYP78_06470 [Candidatus Omnitrophica bacterium]|nr:hypothetical protein [Candidatus Omnitrophota bacterium]
MKPVYLGLLILIFLIPLGRYPITFAESFEFFQLKLLYIIFLLLLLIYYSFISSLRPANPSLTRRQREIREQTGYIKSSSLYIPLVLFVTLGILSLMWTVSYYATSTQLFFFIFYFLTFFLSLKVVDNDDTRERLLIVLFFSTLLVCLYAIYQYFWGLDETRKYVLTHKEDIWMVESSRFMSRLYTDRAFSTFIYPNALASFLIMVFPFSIFYSFMYIRKKIIFFTLLVPSLLILFAFVLTFSKGGMIALILSWLTIWIVRMKKRHKLVSVAIIIILLSGGILLSYTNEYFAEKVIPFKDSLRVRLEYWQAGWEMIKERPLSGFGLGCFGRAYAKYKLPQAEETQMAHNNFLQVWAELGIVGFLIFLAIFIFYFREMTPKLRHLDNFSPLQRVFILGGYVSILTFVFHSLGDFSLYVFSVAFNLFLIMGVSCGVGSDGKSGPQSKSKGRFFFFTMIVFSIFFILLLLKPLLAERHLIRGLEYRKNHDLDRTIEELKLSTRYWAWGENEYRQGYHYLLSQLYKDKMSRDRRDFTPQIIRHLELANKYDRYRSLYWRELAQVRWMRGEKDRAIRYMKKAISCYPVYSVNHLFLGDMYRGKNEKQKALAEYRIALKYDPSLEEIIEKRIQELEELE